MSFFLQAVRMTLRDWRAGELRFLLLALAIAVSALSSVSFFIDRIQAGIRDEAAHLLGADMVIVSDREFDSVWLNQAKKYGLARAETRIFPTMVLSGKGGETVAKLVSLKAVSENYPLRGAVRIAGEENDPGKKAATIPGPGTVWADPELLREAGIRPGDRVRIGNGFFRVTQRIVAEPDRGISFIHFAPRIMMSLLDLEKTGLVQPASRVSYRLLLAGNEQDIERYRKWAEERIKAVSIKGMRIETLEMDRPEMKTTLTRARQFLSLAGLLTAMLASVAIVLGARRFVSRHLDACAILRCLGLTQRQITLMYLTEFFLLGLAGCLIGILAGYLGHLVLLGVLERYLPQQMAAADWKTVVKCLLIGLSLLLGFALPPIQHLRRVSFVRVIRRETDFASVSKAALYLPGLIVFAGLLFWLTGDVRLGVWILGGFAGLVTVMALLARGALKVAGLVRKKLPFPGWRFSLASLERKPVVTVVQIIALATGLMCVLLLTAVKNDLIGAWQRAVPADAPNRFIVNILPGQKETVEKRLVQAGLGQPGLYPMVRGRLIEINGKSVDKKDYDNERAKRLVDREFNLSYMPELPPQNTVVEGSWFGKRRGEASLEERLAKTLGVKTGDKLTFDVIGNRIEVTVTSLRKLDWSSARVNFFVIVSPDGMEEMPQTWITAVFLPPGQTGVATELSREFPNLTVVDIGHIVAQVRTMLDRVTLAVEFLFLFTLASGILVLYAALTGTQEERMHEASVLRTLGATRLQLRRTQRVELVFIGSMAGLLSATGAELAGWMLAVRVFELEWAFSPAVWGYGFAGGIVCALAGGWLGLRKVLNTPPVQSLRSLQ